MYNTINVKFWSDKKTIKKLSPDGKLLMLYLMSNKDHHYIGLYEILTSTILEETGLNKPRYEKACKELSDFKLVLFDIEADLVWVVNRFRYNLTIGNRTNLIKGVPKQLVKLHRSSLINAFHNKYKDLDYPIPMGYEWVADPSNIDIDIDTVIVINKGGEKITKPVKAKYDEFITFTEEEYLKLIEGFGEALTKTMITRLNNYKASTGKPYKSDYHTILNWVAKDEKEGKGKKEFSFEDSKAETIKALEGIDGK